MSNNKSLTTTKHIIVEHISKKSTRSRKLKMDKRHKKEEDKWQ